MLIEHLHIQSQRKYIYIFSPREKIYICIFSLRKEISTYPVTRIRYLHIDLQGIYIYIYTGFYIFSIREMSTHSSLGRIYLHIQSQGEDIYRESPMVKRCPKSWVMECDLYKQEHWKLTQNTVEIIWKFPHSHTTLWLMSCPGSGVVCQFDLVPVIVFVQQQWPWQQPACSTCIQTATMNL